MIHKRFFLQWLLLVLTYSVISYFCYKMHVFYSIWKVDISHVTSVIAALFAITCLYLGFATWRADINPIRANADANIGRTIAYVLTLMGILGTVKGLMGQVSDLGTLNVADAAAVTSFLGIVVSSLSTALYATAAGIISSIGVTILTMNLEYAVDVNDEATQIT